MYFRNVSTYAPIYGTQYGNFDKSNSVKTDKSTLAPDSAIGSDK